MVSGSLIRESKTFVNSSSSVTKGKELARVSIVGSANIVIIFEEQFSLFFFFFFLILRAVPESKLMWLRCGTQIDPIKCKFATASTRSSSKVRALKLPSSGLGASSYKSHGASSKHQRSLFLWNFGATVFEYRGDILGLI